MKARAQSGLGIALLAGAPVAAVVLCLLGVQLVSANFESLSSSAGAGWSGGWVGHLSVHWSLIVLMFVAFLGLWLLTRSKHEKPRA